jgi:uncharacterized protein (TIGR02266 family)
MEGMKSPAELRAHPRATLEIAVNLESEHNFYTGITCNISEGGVFVATYMPPPRGSCVAMVLVLPDGPPLRVQGVVCWIRDFAASCEGLPPGCGIRWVGLSEEALAAIGGFVASRETLFVDHDDLQ